MGSLSDIEPPVLRITIETGALLPAEEVQELLEQVARGFDRHARASGQRHLRLALRRIDTGTLLVDLMVVSSGALPSLDGAGNAARSFLRFVDRLLAIAQGLTRGSLRRADEQLIDALQQPVVDSVATSVELSVVGDHSPVTMDRGTVALVAALRDSAPARRDVAPKRAVPAAPAPLRLTSLEGKHGTVFDVKGRWYVQLEGEEEVLNPLVLQPGVEVVDGGVYRFEGVWERRSYLIRAAVRIA